MNESIFSWFTKKGREERQTEKKKDLALRLFLSSIGWIVKNYEDCEIGATDRHHIWISADNLLRKKQRFSFKIEIDNSRYIPEFTVTIILNSEEINFTCTGTGQIHKDYSVTLDELKDFLINTVYYEWFDRNQKQKKNYRDYDDYDDEDYNDYDYFGNKRNHDYNKGTGNYKTSTQSTSTESPEIQNKRRRYLLLKDVLAGYLRELVKIQEWEKKNPGKKHTDKDSTQNQIDNVKDKMNLMNKTYHFESVYYLKHLTNLTLS